MNEQDSLPAPSCIVPNDVAHRIGAMESKLDEIHNALVGDKFGNRGFMGRLDIVERAIENHNQKFLTWGGVVVGAVAVFELVKHKIGL